MILAHNKQILNIAMYVYTVIILSTLLNSAYKKGMNCLTVYCQQDSQNYSYT